MTTTKYNEHKKLNFSSEREQTQACLNSAEHEKNQGRKVLNLPNMSFSIPNAPIKDTCVKMLTSVDSALGNNMSLCALYTLQKQHLLRQMFI